MKLAAVAGAAVCALAVGCGTIPAVGPRAGDGGRAALIHSGGPTEAGNRRLAESEAARLLALVRPPAHAARLRSAPPSLAYPLTGLPAVQSLVDRSGFWRLPMSYPAALAWLAALRPAGLHRDGSGSVISGGTPSAGFDYTGPANQAWQSAELDVLVATDSHGGSVLRADGLVVWLDPVPYRDTAPGKRLRVLTSASCPGSDAGVVGVRNTGSGLAAALLPRDTPLAGLTCTYDGMNGRAYRLQSQQRLTAAQARRLASEMARLSLTHAVGEVVDCPADVGTAELVAFGYAGRPDVDLWVWLSGCGDVSNGVIMTAGPF